MCHTSNYLSSIQDLHTKDDTVATSEYIVWIIQCSIPILFHKHDASTVRLNNVWTLSVSLHNWHATSTLHQQCHQVRCFLTLMCFLCKGKATIVQAQDWQQFWVDSWCSCLTQWLSYGQDSGRLWPGIAMGASAASNSPSALHSPLFGTCDSSGTQFWHAHVIIE